MHNLSQSGYEGLSPYLLSDEPGSKARLAFERPKSVGVHSKRMPCSFSMLVLMGVPLSDGTES